MRSSCPVCRETTSGRVLGNVAWAYTRAFLPDSQYVSGAGIGFQYDDDQLLTQAGALAIARDDSSGFETGTTLGSVTTALTYNAYGEAENEQAQFSASVIYAAATTRDALGRITARTEQASGDSSRSLIYDYDLAGRLREVWRGTHRLQHFGYDANGNRDTLIGSQPSDTLTATYDAQDRLLRHGTVGYRYGANGELTQKLAGSDTTRYQYDALGNLIRVRFPSGDSIRYVIDPRNRRVGRIANGTWTRRWLYQDQLEPVAEVDASGAVLARFVYGSRAHVPDYVVKDSTYRLITDQLGSVRLVVNVSSGTIAQRLRYDAWGRVLEDTNPGFQPFGFAGGLWDAATGLLRFGARDYDPGVGRWTAKDPAIFLGNTANLYMYSHADPINNIDPSGRRPLTKCEKSKLSPYVPKQDLDAADITDKWFPPLLSQDYVGVTIGTKIYFRPGAYNPSSVTGLALLAHELVHVGQYRDGMTVHGYLLSGLLAGGDRGRMKYELEADAIQKLTMMELRGGCPCELVDD